MIDCGEEIQSVYRMLVHPAGFDVDIDGILWVRRYDDLIWAVEWEVWANDGSKSERIEVREFDIALDAAVFFVQKRHEMKLGLDYGD